MVIRVSAVVSRGRDDGASRIWELWPVPGGPHVAADRRKTRARPCAWADEAPDARADDWHGLIVGSRRALRSCADARRPRILVADDQTDILQALRLLLGDAGFETDLVSSVDDVARSRVRRRRTTCC